MATLHRLNGIELPRSGNHEFYELPEDMQKQVRALEALTSALDYLDGAERDGRGLDTSDSPADRAEWRNRQRDSLDTYRLAERLRCRLDLAYIRWLIECAESEGDGKRGPKLVALHRAEIELDAKLSLLAQEA